MPANEVFSGSVPAFSLAFAAVVTVAVLAGGCSTIGEGGVVEGPAPLRVAVYCDKGPGGVGACEWFRMVDRSPEAEIVPVDGEAVRDGALDGVDVLVMPGGASIEEGKSLGYEGIVKLKDFIRGGGGYIGTCAGCCLLMDDARNEKYRARVIPWNSLGSEHGPLHLNFKFNEKGRAALGFATTNHTARYSGGPLMRPTTNVIEGAVFEEWATVDAEATRSGRLDPKKRMHGAAAVVGGTYGKGRVVVFSFHPEYYPGTFYLINAAFRWVSGRKLAFPRRYRRAGAAAVGFYTGGIGSIKDARAVIDLDRAEDLDLTLVNAEMVSHGALEHLDVLVTPGAAPRFEKTPARRRLLREFRENGGRVVELTGVADAVEAVRKACLEKSHFRGGYCK